MSYFQPNITAMAGYVPGEQPSGGKFIKLNTNENPYPCSAKVTAAIKHAVQAGLQRYPDPSASAFRVRASELLKETVTGIGPDWILCGNGSDDLLTIITRALVDPGSCLRYPNPTYILYHTLAEIQGATCHVVDYVQDRSPNGLPSWSLDEQFTAPDESLRLAILANPNSPSGTQIDPQQVLDIADALPCPLLVDEAYADFANSNCLSLVAKNEKILVTRTLSKSYALAGLRFGYLVAQPQMIEQFNKVKDSYNCDTLAIAGATAAIDDQAWLTRTRTAILATRQRLTNALSQRGFLCTPSQANFVWCQHKTIPAAELYRQLKQDGVLVRYLSYPRWEPGLRISVGTDEQIDALLTLLERY
ncbi:MAG: histidinol-phosphate transaminase [Pirellulales bacterium]